MLEWPQTLFNLTNQAEHQNDAHKPVQCGPITVKSPGRFTVTLSRHPIDTLTNSQVNEQLMEEYGLEEDSFNFQDYAVPQQLTQNKGDFGFVLGLARVELGGDAAAFKELNGIGAISAAKRLVNDGNTIIYQFWDEKHHYVLLHEIKY